eukprot:COSAG02_NODE_6960_length_3261_cov_11.863393_3_plen_41_part_01
MLVLVEHRLRTGHAGAGCVSTRDLGGGQLRRSTASFGVNAL